MGDFLPPQPGHGAEHERLRRRFERYRQLHASRQQQYDSFASRDYNQQAHETQLLHRRWQDSKKPAAKTAASTKVSSRGDGMATGAPSTTAVTAKKFKRTANGQFKAESPPSTGVCTTGGVNVAESLALTPSGSVGAQTPPVHNSLSVNINVDANLHRSESAIKLTFSSTINGHTAPPVSQHSQQMVPRTSMTDLCKSELSDTKPCPADDADAQTADFAAAAAGDGMENLEYLDELSELLEKLDEDTRCFGVPGETNALSERSAGTQGTREVVGSSGRYASAALYPPGYPADAAAAAPGCVGLIGTSANAPTLLGDTGPAAETLKQMAAQHQSLHENSGGARHYAYPEGYHPAAGFNVPTGHTRMPRYTAMMGPGSGYMMGAVPSSMCHVDGHAAAVGGKYTAIYQDTQYRSPAPSSAPRFSAVPPHNHCVTSSLQRLESQVRSQFTPMSTDTQQQQQQFRLEQSQRVDVRAPGPVVVAQQQQSLVLAMEPQHVQPTSQRPYPPSGNSAAAAPGSQFSQPGAYRPPTGSFVSGNATVPCSWHTGGMPGRNQQQGALVPPVYPGSHAHDSDKVVGVQTNTRTLGGRSSSSTPSATHVLQAPTTAAVAQQQQAKREAVYSSVDLAPDIGGVKGSVEASATPSYAGMSLGKLTHSHQRPPNVTVVPGPPGAVNFHPHVGGVKWIPGGPARHAYPDGYGVDSVSNRASDTGVPAGAGWSLSMSQTQSLYMYADSPYHNCVPSNPAAGYAAPVSAGPLHPADTSRMKRMPNQVVVPDVMFQQNQVMPGPSHTYIDAYPAGYDSRDFAFTDSGFASK